MSNQDQGNPQDSLSLQDVPKWAGRYAANRMIHVLVPVGLLVVLCTVTMSATLYAVGSGRAVLIVLSLVFDLLILALYLYLLARWSLKGTGAPATFDVGRAAPDFEPRKYDWILLLPLALILILAGVFLVPEQYWQPLTAVYLVPALVYLVGRNGWVEWPFLLCPILYAEHAILVLAGVRLYIGVWYMDVFVPLGLYALLGGLAAHIYSLYAMRRLRDLTRQTTSEDE